MPVYLAANENATPQLKFVIVSDGTRVEMARTLASGVAALGGHLAAIEPASPADTARTEPAGPTDWMQRAVELMREADARLRAGDFAGFGAAWNRLKTLLEQQSTGTAPR